MSKRGGWRRRGVDERAAAGLALRHDDAIALLREGQPELAVPQLEQILIGCRTVFGLREGPHPHVIELRVALARAHAADGQMLAAVAELDAAIAASATAYGPEHQETTDLHAERDELQPAAT